MRNFEDIVFFPKLSNQYPYDIEMAGISYCDSNYHITRKNSTVYVFEYVIKGKGTIIHNNQKFTVQQGDVYILKAGYKHDYYADSNDPWEKIWFNVSGSLIGHLLEDYKLNIITVIKKFNDPTLFNEFFKTVKNKDLSRLEILNKTSLIIHELVQKLYTKSPIYKGEESDAHTIKKYIDNHLDKIVSIEELSELIYRSPSRVIQIFKKEYNTTPYEYSLSKKIEISKMLLINSNLNINTISEKIGFCDAHYFSNYFKKMVGTSPKNYRKSFTI